MLEELGHQQGIAEVLNNLGPAYLKTGRARLARAGHERALDLARTVGDTRNEARALEGAGWCALEVGAFTTGIDRLRQALAIYQDIGAAEAANLAARLTDIEASGN
jgi:Tfp pilus assembly protein PilF